MNEEEKTNQESENSTGNNDNGIQQKTKAENLAEREALVEKEEDLIRREAEIKAQKDLGGETQAGQVPEKPAEETSEDYSKDVLSGKIQAK